MKELKEGLRLTLKSAPDDDFTDCRQCYFYRHDDKTDEHYCDLYPRCGCNLPWPLVFVLDDDDNETVSR